MSALASVPPPAAPATLLTPGTLIGSRFEIEAADGCDSLGQTYAARDQKTKKPVGIYLLGPAIAGDPALLGRVGDAARNLAKLQHNSLVGVYAVGSQDEHHYIAREWLTGQVVDELIAERKQQKRWLSVRGVYNMVAHVCKALNVLHATSIHGALRPSVVTVTKSGRIKVGDADVGSALVKARRIDLLPEAEQAFLAPEVKAGGELDVRTDVFGVGALLYALLTARSPLDAFVIPSQLRDDASPELDALMMRCLASDKTQRFGSIDQLVRALLPLVAAAPTPLDDDFSMEIEIDIDVATSFAPPAPSLVPVMIIAESIAPPGPPPLPSLEPQAALSDLTNRLTANDSPRWIAVKNGMDHGPFTARELIKLIVDGEVLDEHVLFNMSSSDRKPLDQYPEFEPFRQQYRIRRDEHDHARALARSTTVEKRSTAAKFVILAVSIGTIALLGGGYLKSRQAAQERERHDADLAALYESGQVKISGTAGILRVSPRPAGTKRTQSSGSPGGGGFTSYEDAMNQAMELNLGKAGGERQLTSGDVAGVMNRELNRMFGCVGEELRKGGKLGHVVIDLAIMGSGHVAGASVNVGSAGFQHCIAAKLKDVHFPEFPAPRMGARYSFAVD
jgi:serine/threonine protein kinase